MKIERTAPLACPLDGAPLTADAGRLRCPHGHSFDQARQGYYHLLPVQAKRSREPGDSKAMVEARGRFLDAGFYQPISEALNALALRHLAPSGAITLADAGCGEGYYLDRLARALVASDRPGNAQLIGLDIAKPAVQAATRRNRDITWLVATNRRPCLLPGSVDLILCMFGFPEFGAFAEALRPGGRLLLVDAGEGHLLELREIIYPEVRRRAPPSLEKATRSGFELIESERLRYRTPALDRERIADLLVMTPHLYRAPHAGKTAAAALESLEVTVDVSFRVLAACRAESELRAADVRSP